MTSSAPRIVSGSDPLPVDLAGRIRDVDSHEMLPPELWAKEYGDFVAPLLSFFAGSQSGDPGNSTPLQDSPAITHEALPDYWSKGCLAPSAYEMERRPQFLDVAGIRDSMIFGTVMAITGQELAGGCGPDIERLVGSKMDFDAVAMGNAMLKAHNDWCIRTARISSRLRPVASLMTRTLKEAMDEAMRVIDGGVRAVMLCPAQSFAGRAPSHHDNDPFWTLLADNNVPVLFHIGMGTDFFARECLAWADSPLFKTNAESPPEEPQDLFGFSVCSLPAQNYLSNLVMGAVFERVPHLRCGFMELGSFWVGPIARNMDMLVEHYPSRYRNTLSMKPSEYMRRNVRVSPFTFEPVDTFIELYPFVEDVMCFSTDFPHVEGGRNPIGDMIQRVARLGPAITEKFFVGNAEWVMP